MCYTLPIATQKTPSSPRCAQCNSELIIIDKITEQRDGAYFEQTTTTYRCSNTSCQEEIDKQTAKRIKLKQERQEESDRRAERKSLQKKLAK